MAREACANDVVSVDRPAHEVVASVCGTGDL